MQKCDDLVSLVIPVYNVEKYLDACLYSLENQTYRNIEILLIDDGSTDQSSSICQNHAVKDSRIRYLKKQNGGLSSARNYGLKQVRGKWTAYIDSDDMVDPNYVERLLESAIETNAVITVCGFSTVDEGGTAYRASVQRVSNINVDAIDALRILLSEQYSGCAACGKIAKTDLWRQVVFPEGRQFEDFPVISNLFRDRCVVSLLLWDGYAYRKRDESITAERSLRSAHDLCESIVELRNSEAAQLRGLSNAVAFKVCLECTRLIRLLSHIRKGPEQAQAEKNRYRKFANATMCVFWRAALKDRDASFSQRMRLVLFRFSPRIATGILRCACFIKALK